MIYERKEFTLKNGLKITVRSPEKKAGLISKWIDVDCAVELFSHYADYTETNEEKRGIYQREYMALKRSLRSI